jgi:hypothetical protein
VPWRGPCCGGARSPAVRPGLPSSRSVKLASKRRRRQCRAVPGRRSPASGPGRRRDGAPAADRACRGLVVVSGGWQAAVAGVCSCWRCCGQWRAAHRAAPGRRSPASEPGRRPDGTPAADRACRGLVRISGCSITGSASGSSFSRSLKPATKRRRRQCRAVPGGDRRQAGYGDGETAHRLPIGHAVAWPVLGRCSIAGSAAGSSFSRSLKPATKRRRRQRRAAPGRRSPASGPGRRPDGTPAADRACRGLVKVSVCWQASVAGVCQGSRRRGSCWWCCGQGVQLVGQHLEGDRRQVSQGEGQTAHRQPIGRAVAWSWCRVAGKPRLQACARAGGAVVSGVQLIEQHLEGDRRQVSQGEGQTAHRQPIGRAVAWSGSRGARSPAVLPGLRSLDR